MRAKRLPSGSYRLGQWVTLLGAPRDRALRVAGRLSWRQACSPTAQSRNPPSLPSSSTRPRTQRGHQWTFSEPLADVAPEEWGRTSGIRPLALGKAATLARRATDSVLVQRGHVGLDHRDACSRRKRERRDERCMDTRRSSSTQEFGLGRATACCVARSRESTPCPSRTPPGSRSTGVSQPRTDLSSSIGVPRSNTAGASVGSEPGRF